MCRYIISSDQLVNALSTKFPSKLPAGVKLFSFDATGMYPNIYTPHGLQTIEEFIKIYGPNSKTLIFQQNLFLNVLKSL